MEAIIAPHPAGLETWDHNPVADGSRENNAKHN